MVCQECLEKREKSLKTGINQNRRILNNNSLSLHSIRKVGVNMHLEHKKFAFDPIGIKCNICKGRVEMNNLYCLQCAFSKGICESCGKKVSDVRMYKQSDIDYKKLKKIKEADRQQSLLKKGKQSKNKNLSNLNNLKGNKDLIKRKKEDHKSTSHQKIKLKKLKLFSHENDEDEIDLTQNIQDIYNKVSYDKIKENDKVANRNIENNKVDNEPEVEIDDDYYEVIKI